MSRAKEKPYIPSLKEALRMLADVPVGYRYRHLRIDKEKDNLKAIEHREYRKLMASPAAAAYRTATKKRKQAESRADAASSRHTETVSRLRTKLKLEGVTPTNLKQLKKLCLEK